jgi:hypothetical protein
MPLTIDRRLNLVIPVETEGGEIFVHSAPISRQAFEASYSIIARTFQRIHTHFGNIAGVQVAALIMREIAAQDAYPNPVTGNPPFLAEVYRLTNVMVPGGRGYEAIPYEDALRLGKINEEDAAEIDNALVFFTVASSMYRRAVLPVMLAGAMRLWSALTTPLNCMEWAASLKTSTTAENTGATAQPTAAGPGPIQVKGSSIPS